MLTSFQLHWFKAVWVKRGSYFSNFTLRKGVNALRVGLAFVRKAKRVSAHPIMLKIDLSPVCQLKCPVCFHADPVPESNLLAKQRFSTSQMMSLEQFQTIIDQAEGKVQALYMYYLGEPFLNKDACKMARYARDAGINVLVSSNMSIKFSDEKIAEIADSGITHLEVGIEGATQEDYAAYRIGGRLDLVLDNIKRLAAYKKQHGLRYPKIEVQFLEMKHNVGGAIKVKNLFEKGEVQMFTVEEGDTGNWAELALENTIIEGPVPTKLIPTCMWPYSGIVIKYNGDVIPCCIYNGGNQYQETETEDSRVLGNVFKDGLLGVWNNSNYQEVRAYVGNPQLIKDRPDYEKSFCHGCPQVSNGSLRTDVLSPDSQFDFKTNRPTVVSKPGSGQAGP